MEDKAPENFVDGARAVRTGEELDGARLMAYLRARLPELEGELEVEQFPAGFSNLTYLVRVCEKEFVLRRPPFGARIKTAHDMGREYKILAHLHPVYTKVPRPVLFCQDETIIGAPFYIMERVKGIILRAQVPTGLNLPPAVMRGVSQSFLENLIEIHEVDYKAAGLSDLGQPLGYVSRQIEGWTKRYYNARTREVASIERLASWLIENAPADSAHASLIHNDYKYDNAVLAPQDLSKVIAVLDWEMATIGDPLMDLGTTLGYWVEPDDPEEWQRYGFGLTTLPGNFSRAEIVEFYVRRTGRHISNPVFYYAYGLLKMAVIVQQIYFRFRQGLTKDERFAALTLLVETCGQLAWRAIEKKRIDKLG